MAKYCKDGPFGVDGKQRFMDDRHAVENEGGSGERACKCCDSWLAHWQNNAGSARARCAYLGCSAEARHGAHIKFVDMDKLRKFGKSWLIPLCAKHNNPNHKYPFYIDKTVTLIQEGPAARCGKTVTQANRNRNYEMTMVRSRVDLTCGCKTVSDHYAANCKSSRSRCVVTPCGASTREFGVMKSNDGRTDKGLWIAPVCRAHKSARDPVFIESTAWLVALGPGRNCP